MSIKFNQHVFLDLTLFALLSPLEFPKLDTKAFLSAKNASKSLEVPLRRPGCDHSDIVTVYENVCNYG